MACSNKIDSNFTGLRYAVEALGCVGTLPGATAGVTDSVGDITLRATITGAVLPAFVAVDPAVATYTALHEQTIDNAGTALAAALQTALVGVPGSAVTYNSGTDTITIPADRNIGDAIITVEAFNGDDRLVYTATINAPGAAATARTIVLVTTGLTAGAGVVWKELEPNEYGDFGPTVSKVSRTPIKAGRQREKGVTSDLDATANFGMDVTADNLEGLMPGFMFADWRRAATPTVNNGVRVATAGATILGANADVAFAVNSIVQVRGFVTDTATNGTYVVTAVANNQITVQTLDGSSPTFAVETPVNARIVKVGVRAAAADVAVDAAAPAAPALTSTLLNFTTLGLIPGQWVYVGGDVAGSSFASPANNGFMRVRTIAANRLTFDKTQNTMVTVAAGPAVHLYVGQLIKNEADPALIKSRSYQFERSLVSAGYEYVVGAVANTMAINVSASDKITVDLGFVATDAVAVLPASRKAGSFPAIATSAVAFNTSSDFSRIRLATQGALATPLTAFLTSLTLNINNNVTPIKAIGTLGAFDTTVGDFVVEGEIEAYFSSIEATQAVRNNTSVTFDFAIAKDNAGWVFDIPLVTLGDGRLNVAKDEPITIPVSTEAARDPTLNTTLIAVYFPYLPTVAEG